MKQAAKIKQRQGRRNKHQLYKPRNKRTPEEDAAIQYLQGRYDKIVPEDIKTFKDLPLSQKTLKGLKDNNYHTPTEIQRQAIGYALQGKDILGAAHTGSGKTLAFLIPILENLFCKKWTRVDGVGALVISPTRELAYQIYQTLRKVGGLHDFSAGLIIGGQNLKFERKRMDQVNILICTPGRLLQHMDENPLFDCTNLQILVLDEADRCLDMGFAATMNGIIENLPPERQTLLFSATQTKSVKDLARLSLSFPTYVAPHEKAETVTPESLQQSYIVCELHEKLGILWSFIKNHLKQKVLVFMSTCKQVKYTYELFCKLRPGVSLLAIYGGLHQEKREKIYNDFCRKSNIVLFATDLASRGLDFPKVNWVIQYDCPEDVQTYIHRAGRTARGVFGKGEGLLMLLPHEEKFVEDLRTNKIPINKILIDSSKIITPQKKIGALISENEALKQTAHRAIISYVKSVFVMKNKEIFNVKLLDIDAYSKSLGIMVPPNIRFMHKIQNKNKINEEDWTNKLEKLKHQVDDDKEESDETEEADIQNSSEEDFNDKETKKLPEDTKKVTKTNKKLAVIEFHGDDIGDIFEAFSVKRKIENTAEEEIGNQLEEINKTKKKPLTKAAVAKMILSNKLKINPNIKFSEDEDESKSIEHFDKLDSDKIKELFAEQDKNDKLKHNEKIRTKHKEEKRKLKNKSKEENGEKDDFGSASESDGPDLSWLPDPDKIYESKKDADDDNSSDETNGVSDENEDSDEDECSDDIANSDEISQKSSNKGKRKLKLIDIPQKNKKKKIGNLSASLSVQEAEALAMQLLMKK